MEELNAKEREAVSGAAMDAGTAGVFIWGCVLTGTCVGGLPGAILGGIVGVSVALS